MIIIAGADSLDARRSAARGPLAPLFDSLALDLEPWLTREIVLPPEKARMTRLGGRCPRDSQLLAFDPASPRRHTCAACGTTVEDDEHYRWWIMNYHLWLAERAVHGALLWALGGHVRHRDFAARVLDAYADQYLRYPNEDNVLGPTRPFFSTYLESIWLLQLVVALDLLQLSSGADAVLGGRVRERVIEPSAELICSYDEGFSNRQIWNDAAIAAAGLALGRRALVHSAMLGPSGVQAALATGLLEDGSWYEGENYHLFAHRGLGYGVELARAARIELDPDLVARFDRGFSTPFATALPDFTFPARRDSQFGVSLRQWRFAESCELGLARNPGDGRLLGALHALYTGNVPRRDTGRATSTAEAERNVPASLLARTDLGWRSLAGALPELPALEPRPARSVLLPAQGFAILRRDAGRVYLGLDYGHHGGGHGHPDRLNLLFADSDARWLDDMGTGSYTMRDLFWYRSSIAHNAPLVDGRTQHPVHGRLLAFMDGGGAGWIDAEVGDAAPDVTLRRTIVAMPDYAVDVLAWRAPRAVTVDLPLHVGGTVHGAGTWRAASPVLGPDPDAGFAWLSETEEATVDAGATVRLDTAGVAGRRASCWAASPSAVAWWRALAPGAPGQGARRMHLIRGRGDHGQLVCVWSWVPAHIAAMRLDGDRITIETANGERHHHSRSAVGWLVELEVAGARSTIDLGGIVLHDAPPRRSRPRTPPPVNVPTVLAATAPRRFDLGAAHWRGTEPSWEEAGRPAAVVTVTATPHALCVDVHVQKTLLAFAPRRADNPLDNEPSDTNSDGVQVHLAIPEFGVPMASWLLVPEPDGAVRITPAGDTARAGALAARWEPTADGYVVRTTVSRDAALAGGFFRIDVLVNVISPARERRSGQLVLSGANGERAYLRGDRQPVDRYLPMVIADA